MMNMLNKLLGNVPMYYNGGGKSGGDQVYVPPPIKTNTSVGSQLDAEAKTVEEEDKTSAVDKAKLGTRGLQIPLASTNSTTTTPTAATAGIQK